MTSDVNGPGTAFVDLHTADVLDRATVEAIVPDFIGTGMRLPVSTGAALSAWANEAWNYPVAR